MPTNKAALDWEQLRAQISQPHFLGPMLGAMPGLTRTLAGATGGLGLMGAVDLLRNRGQNFGAFFKGRLADRQPAAGPMGTITGPTPRS